MIAAGLAAGCGCGSYVTETRRCVDQYGKLIPESYCSRGYSGGYYGGYRPMPRFVYGGDERGGMVRNFRSSPTEGSEIRSSTGSVIRSGTVRGGFGGSG
ncbi:hypothetical protein EON81_15895, partial [bacterium]